MRRRFWERLSESGTAVAWAIILIGAAGLAATLRAPDRSSAAAIALLSLAAIEVALRALQPRLLGGEKLAGAVALAVVVLWRNRRSLPWPRGWRARTRGPPTPTSG